MKKKVVLLLVSLMVATTVLAGCGTDETKSSSAGSEATAGTDGSAVAEETVTYGTEEILSALAYDIDDAVTLPENYKDFEIQLETDYTVTDEMVNTYLESSILPYYKDYEVVDRAAEDGDSVNIDYEGKKDGVAFDGGTAQGYDLVLGSDSFIDGFEDGLVGAKAGDTLDLNLTFPEEYGNEELAGQDVVFTVTVNSVSQAKAVSLDTITDEFVANNFSYYGCSTVDELLALVKENVEYEYDSNKTSEIQDKVLGVLVENSTFTFPESLQTEIDEAYDSMMTSIEEAATEADSDLETYISDNYSETVEEYQQDVKDYIDKTYKQSLVTSSLIRKLEVTTDSDEISSYVNYYLQNYGSSYGFSSEEDVYTYFGGKENFILMTAKNNALSQVMESVNVLEKE